MNVQPRVLYICCGNLAVPPRTGLDLAIHDHALEMLTMEHVDLIGVFIAPGVVGRNECASGVRWRGFSGFTGDVEVESQKIVRVIRKILFAASGGLLVFYSFKSTPGIKYIEEELKKGCDLVIIDGMATFATIRPWRLKKHCNQMVFIAHDVTFRGILDDGHLQTSWIKKILRYGQAVKAWMFEIYVLKQAKASIFTCEPDRQTYSWVNQLRSLTVCPGLSASRSQLSSQRVGNRDKTLVFIGPIGFAPNKFAIDWIAQKLAPRLERIDPSITITIVGKGTDVIDNIATKNIKGLGIVSDEDLSTLLGGCVAFMCPVIHGSGIKTKVLESLAAGCPVFATKESLRGLEFLGIKPRIDIDNPEACAVEIAQFANNVNTQDVERAAIKRRWEQHIIQRKGQLARVITNMLYKNGVQFADGTSPRTS